MPLIWPRKYVMLVLKRFFFFSFCILAVLLMFLLTTILQENLEITSVLYIFIYFFKMEMVDFIYLQIISVGIIFCLLHKEKKMYWIGTSKMRYLRLNKQKLVMLHYLISNCLVIMLLNDSIYASKTLSMRRNIASCKKCFIGFYVPGMMYHDGFHLTCL